ncbi:MULTISPECIES: hypothetical protein [Enterobacter cloacae complex]|uniref:hypothetical protein n=1 Tax=Enterobacter cloacae complex TaxID=354276 RepID=UPI0005178DA4|nr:MULTISPECIES: hypothetical protein [Enterobacter cloacae complex]ELZ1063215.1 hypothetical protein [Escherichia coli]HAS0803281.1 hypothetical protein [Enterobacter roggenkampii]HAT7722046.1 hypothetical protein [Enterobacter roggenkampii]
MKKLLFLLAVVISYNGMAEANSVVTTQCGNFTLVARVGEMTEINGEMVTSQKITELGQNGMKVEMTLMPASDGNLYGFEYIHPDGSKKHWLNVELIRTNLNQGRIIGTFDCKRVKE